MNDIESYIATGEPYTKSGGFGLQSLGASLQTINELKHRLKKGQTIDQALDEINLPQHILSFLRFTFEVINTKKKHIIAAVFIISFFPRSNLFLEFFVYVFLGVVWALPFKFIFKGIGQIEKKDN